jgi:hypothetical protein
MCFGCRLLAVVHEAVHELGDDFRSPYFGVRDDFALFADEGDVTSDLFLTSDA